MFGLWMVFSISWNSIQCLVLAYYVRKHMLTISQGKRIEVVKQGSIRLMKLFFITYLIGLSSGGLFGISFMCTGKTSNAFAQISTAFISFYVISVGYYLEELIAFNLSRNSEHMTGSSIAKRINNNAQMFGMTRSMLTRSKSDSASRSVSKSQVTSRVSRAVGFGGDIKLTHGEASGIRRFQNGGVVASSHEPEHQTSPDAIEPVENKNELSPTE